MIEIINKPLLLHLVGYLYYWQMGFNSVFKGLNIFHILKACIIQMHLHIILHLRTISHVTHFFNIFLQNFVLPNIYSVHIVSIIMSARIEIWKYYAGITKTVFVLCRNIFFFLLEPM